MTEWINIMTRKLEGVEEGPKVEIHIESINHLMYMGDIKLFAKNEKELLTLIHTVRL